MAKRRSSKQVSKISIRTILFVIIILAAVAAVITYFIYQSEKNQNSNKLGPSASQIKIKPNTPPVISATKPKSPIDGNWVNNNNGVMLNIHNSKFSIDSPSVDNHTFYKGNISIQGKLLVFTFTSKITPCGNQKGRYIYSIKNNQLRLKVKTDSCIMRKNKLEGTWSHF